MDLQARLENQTREQIATREALLVANERQQSLSVELQQMRGGLREHETRYLETLRVAEHLRGELKAAVEARQHLEQQTNPIQAAQPSRKAASKPK